jgi:SAM-dependent methyltransferase
MIRLSGLKAGEVALDLGSGDGRIIVAAAMTEPRMRGWGVDIDAALVARANAFAREEGVDDRVRFLHGDVFDADVGRADVIFMWLFPELQRLLRTKILAEARPGTRVVSHLFDMGSWSPDAADPGRQAIRLWIGPARVEGNWTWTVPFRGVERRFDAVLEQRFQSVEGVFRTDDRRREIRDMVLKGDRLSFSLSLQADGGERITHEFSGQVKGDRIEGTVRHLVPSAFGDDDIGYDLVEIGRAPWTAERTPASRFFERTTTLSGN